MNVAAGTLAVLRAAERMPVPWKNGGGVTREVAAHPPGSGLDDFDWRVSIAEVRAAGPFSSFPGIERRMAILAGRLRLAIDGRPAIALAADSEPIAFAGESTVFAEPLEGAVTDLNVMTRRARCSSDLERFSVRQSLRLEPPQGATLLLVAISALALRGEGHDIHLQALDAVLLRRAAVTVDAPATFQLACLRDLPTTGGARV